MHFIATPSTITIRQILTWTCGAIAWLHCSVSAQTHPLDDLAPGHWMALSTNSIHDVDPCPERNCPYSQVSGIAAEMSVWCGAAFASGYGTMGGLIFHCGGHTGYAGSELYAFDVGTRRWSRLTEPYPGGVESCDSAEGRYPDGSPCPQHTYDYVDYDPRTNRFVMLSSQTLDSGGRYSPYAYMFDFDTSTWSQSTIRTASGGFTGASSAYDPIRGIIWSQRAYNARFVSFDPAINDGIGEWATYQRFNISIDAVAAIDPVRDLYLMLEARSRDRIYAFDLKNPGEPAVTLNVTGDTAPFSIRSPGFEWDPAVQKFVCWNQGSSVYTLTPPTGDWKTQSWEWAEVVAAAGNSAVPPAPSSNGTYSKWRYMAQHNAYILATSTDQPIYGYRLSSSQPATLVPPTSFLVE